MRKDIHVFINILNLLIKYIMQFETTKDRKTKENLDRMFGDRESAKDMRQAIYMAQKGLVTDEAVSEYVRLKEQERREYLEVMSEENPDYAFKVGDELLSLLKSKENDVLPESELSSSSATTECGNREYGRDQDAVSEH